MTIDLNPHHLGTVRAILAGHVPDCEVMAFGSRAAWTAHERSDLDLAVDCGGRAGDGAIARLREAFEDSDLPIRVDVLDWHAVAGGFRELIAPGCVVIQQALPPPGERRRVARALDERIEANRRAGAALGEMARALFRHWFVDFGPVRAKAAGLPPGLPPALDALFPPSFGASAQGEAPAGWGWATAGGMTTVLGGSAPGAGELARRGGGHWFVTPKDLSALREPVLTASSRRLTDEGAARARSGILPPGTVLLSPGAPAGRPAIAGVPVVAGRGVVAMVCDGAVGAPYALHWAEANMPALGAPAAGAASPGIGGTALGGMPFLAPPAPVHAAWDSFAAPAYACIAARARESRALAAMRDALLPRLAPGEALAPE